MADGLALGGLACIGVGLWWINPAVALVVVGGLMVVIGAGLGGVRRPPARRGPAPRDMRQ